MYNNNRYWVSHNHTSNHTSKFNKLLQEPVAFEDFQFNLRNDPHSTMSTNDILYKPPSLNYFPGTDTSVLTERDQRFFNKFLEQVLEDPNLKTDSGPFISYNYVSEKEHLSQTNKPYLMQEQTGIFKDEVYAANYSQEKVACLKIYNTKPTRKHSKPKKVAQENTTFICQHNGCDRTFTRPYNLTSHMRTHTSERPFACLHCGRKFSRQHDRNRHERLHWDIRPYACSHCHKTFARMDALNRHIRVGNGCNRKRN